MKRHPRMTRRMEDKLLKAMQAKTTAGRANYLIDAVAEEWLRDYDLDALLHAFVDLGLTDGTDAQKFKRWIMKSIRYGAFSTP